MQRIIQFQVTYQLIYHKLNFTPCKSKLNGEKIADQLKRVKEEIPLISKYQYDDETRKVS